MKEEYTPIDIEVIVFNTEDIIVTSTQDPWEGEES